MHNPMKHKCILLFVILLFIPVVGIHAAGLPEATVTKAHLMKDIDESHTIVGVGSELPFIEDADYVGDLYYLYYGYALRDWVEIDLTLHSVLAFPYPAVEVKIDAMDIFTNSRRLSTLVMGGVGIAFDSEVAEMVYHGGLAVTYQLGECWQIYAGLGGDSLSDAINLQAGAYYATRKWFGMSMGFSLVTGSGGISLTPSLGLAARFRRNRGDTG